LIQSRIVFQLIVVNGCNLDTFNNLRLHILTSIFIQLGFIASDFA